MNLSYMVDSSKKAFPPHLIRNTSGLLYSCYSVCGLPPGMMVHACNPGTRRQRKEEPEFKASVSCIGSPTSG